MNRFSMIRYFRNQLQVKPLYFRILAYFLIMLVPVAVIGLLVYFGNLSVHRNKLIENLDTQLAFSAQTVDSYLRTTEQVAMNFFASETVQRALLPADLKTEAEKAETTSVIKVLSTGRNIMNAYIDNVFVYTDRQFVYLSNGTENYNMFFNRFHVFEPYDEAFWNEMLLTHQSFRVLAPAKVTKSFTGASLTVVPIVVKQYVRGHQAVMVVTISTGNILNTLRSNGIHETTRYAVTDYAGNLIVADYEGDAAALSALFGDGDHAELRRSGGSYIVNRLVSDYGWSYYSITPKGVYYSQAGGILLLTSWFCVLIVAAGVLLSFVFSRRLYNPIHSILEHHQERELFSGVLLENVFHHLLRGHRLQHYEEIMKAIGFTSGQYLCVCIKFEFKEAFLREVQDTEREIILDKLRKVIDGIFREKLTAHVVEAQHQLFVAMINLKHDDDRQVLEESLNRLTDTFRYDLRYCRLAIGIGKTYPVVHGLSDSLDDARMALMRSRSTGDISVMAASDVPAGEAFLFGYLDENRLLNGLRAGMEEAVKEALDDIIDRNVSQEISSTSMHLLLIELYNTGLKFARDKGVATQQLVSADEHRLLSGKGKQIVDLEAHVERLSRFYAEVVKETQTGVNEETKSARLAQEAIAYIEEHYSEDLYLDKLSSELGLSSKYFSKMFKDVTGIGPTDYISMRRIREAKRLLAESRLKNDEIAERIGIVSRATFFRLFKKYEGITPQEYRNSLHGGAREPIGHSETGANDESGRE